MGARELDKESNNRKEFTLQHFLTASLVLAFHTSGPIKSPSYNPQPPYVRQYQQAYRQVARKFGPRAPGRNIVRYDHPSKGRVLASLAVLRRMLHPVTLPAATTTAGAAAAATATGAAGASPTSVPVAAGSPLPACTWQPESGGNPHAYNAGSRAGGYYQILPSTWAANGGTGAPQNAPMSEQTAVAQRIWASSGPSAWVNC